MTSLNSEIEQKLMEKGACLVGFADAADFPADVTGSMKVAISIAACLDAAIIKEISNGPTRSYFQEYKRLNKFLTDLSKATADDLKSRGYKAAAVSPTVGELDYKTLATPLPHKTVATRAGLGWVGKSALLITPKYGAAVRLATVLTDAEFEVGTPTNSSRCGDCNICTEHCPAEAISGENWQSGLPRESIFDAFACCDMTKKLSEKIGLQAHICGICLNVCPWTQKYISRELES